MAKLSTDSIILKCSCDNPNCVEELTATRWEDGTVTLFCFEVDLTQEQINKLIAFLKRVN